MWRHCPLSVLSLDDISALARLGLQKLQSLMPFSLDDFVWDEAKEV